MQPTVGICRVRALGAGPGASRSTRGGGRVRVALGRRASRRAVGRGQRPPHPRRHLAVARSDDRTAGVDPRPGDGARRSGRGTGGSGRSHHHPAPRNGHLHPPASASARHRSGGRHAAVDLSGPLPARCRFRVAGRGVQRPRCRLRLAARPVRGEHRDRRAALAGGPISHSGEFFDFTGVQVTPESVPTPLLLGGNTEPAMRRAATVADGWITSGTPSLSDGLELVTRMRELVGDRRFEVFVRVPGHDRSALEFYAEHGVERLLVWSPVSLRTCRAKDGKPPCTKPVTRLGLRHADAPVLWTRHRHRPTRSSSGPTIDRRIAVRWPGCSAWPRRRSGSRSASA